MERFDQLLQKILLPFTGEKHRGFDNLSVIGGLDKYMLTWIGRAREHYPHDQRVRETLTLAMHLASSYGGLDPARRKKVLVQIHQLITSLIPGGKKAVNQSKPAKPRKNKPSSKKLTEEKIIPVSREVKKETARKLAEKLEASLKDPVTSIRGVGGKTAGSLAELGIRTVEDLLYHLPRDYQDFREAPGLDRVEPGGFHILRGKLEAIYTRRLGRGRSITKSAISDDNGYLTLVWFNQPYVASRLKEGGEYIISGQVENHQGQLQINSPQMAPVEEVSGGQTAGIRPVYPLSAGLGQRTMEKLIATATESHGHLLREILPEDLLLRLDLPGISEALQKAHKPGNIEEAHRATERLRFQEAFLMQLASARNRRQIRNRRKEHSYIPREDFCRIYEGQLPFNLTGAQKKVLKEIIEDMYSPAPMNRLLQGDVGSGKTIICALGTLLTARSGYQSVILAPTEVLAEQHYYSFRHFLEPFGIGCELLIGSVNPRGKEEIKTRLSTGDLPVVVGTHALIQEDVTFARLTFGVVDEQHKFGVMQRAALKGKGSCPDLLFTTATPIPRSLTLTLYGDLDVSIIDEMPPGRQEVETFWVTPDQEGRVWEILQEEISSGGQAYIVCPIIDESENFEATALMNLHRQIQERFESVPVGILHGRMPTAEKEEAMESFASGKLSILVATTVIEVGVDVPGASMMVIMDANRFGLGQLHQLRGRVGRGRRKSRCILLAPRNSLSDQRLKTIVGSSSGFEIAEADLLQRGPGDICGSRQSGLPPLRFLDLARDYQLIQRAREEAMIMEEKDPNFLQKDHLSIKEKLESGYKNTWDIIH